MKRGDRVRLRPTASDFAAIGPRPGVVQSVLGTRVWVLPDEQLAMCPGPIPFAHHDLQMLTPSCPACLGTRREDNLTTVPCQACRGTGVDFAFLEVRP